MDEVTDWLRQHVPNSQVDFDAPPPPPHLVRWVIGNLYAPGPSGSRASLEIRAEYIGDPESTEPVLEALRAPGVIRQPQGGGTTR